MRLETHCNKRHHDPWTTRSEIQYRCEEVTVEGVNKVIGIAQVQGSRSDVPSSAGVEVKALRVSLEWQR